MFLTFYPTSIGYQFYCDKFHGHKFGVKNLYWDEFYNKIFKNLEKEIYFYF